MKVDNKRALTGVLAGIIAPVVAGILVYQWNETVVVPNVNGMKLDEARLSVRTRGLRLKVLNENLNRPGAIVVYQAPAPETRMKKDSEVEVRVRPTALKSIPASPGTVAAPETSRPRNLLRRRKQSVPRAGEP